MYCIVVPPEIVARGPDALRAYWKALTSGSTKNNQVLLMFIGQSRVGKTSLLRSLKGTLVPDEHVKEVLN